MKWQAIFGRFAADFRMLATMTFVTNGGCGEHGQRKIWRVVVKHLPSGELSGIASAACEDVLKQSSHFFLDSFGARRRRTPWNEVPRFSISLLRGSNHLLRLTERALLHSTAQLEGTCHYVDMNPSLLLFGRVIYVVGDERWPPTQCNELAR